MAIIRPVSIVANISGKLCGHDDSYFKTNKRTGRCYAAKVCNPTNVPPTAKQLAAREAFGRKTKMASAWMAANKPTEEMPKGSEAYQHVLAAYKSQNKVGNILVFVRKHMDDAGVISIGGMVSQAPDVPDAPATGGGTTNRQFTVTAVSADTTKGTVTGGGTFSEGSRITLTATPKGGYVFDRWSDGVTTATRTVVVSETKTLTATFKVATETGEDEENYM